MPDPVMEHTTYTWDPLAQGWVHERGAKVAPPATPPDIHALQSYFYDPDSKQWIRTMLAPMGRELAAKWQGAHRIPEGERKEKAKGPKKKGSPIGAVVAFVVLLVLLGGVGVVAAQSGLIDAPAIPGLPAVVDKAKTSAAPVGAPAASVAPAASAPAASAAPAPAAPATAAPAAPTTAPTPAPTTAPTRAPAAPTVNLPAGLRATLPDGTTVVYSGPTSVARGGFLPATFTLVLSNGRPASGEVTIILGDITKDPRIVSGQLDANGRIAVDVPATLPVGAYPLSLSYKGSRVVVATITIR